MFQWYQIIIWRWPSGDSPRAGCGRTSSSDRRCSGAPRPSCRCARWAWRSCASGGPWGRPTCGCPAGPCRRPSAAGPPAGSTPYARTCPSSSGSAPRAGRTCGTSSGGHGGAWGGRGKVGDKVVTTRQ